MEMKFSSPYLAARCLLCVMITTIHLVQCSGQMCDSTIQVSSFSENLLEDDVRTCIECVIGGSVATTATWLIGTAPLVAATVPIDPSDGEVVNGVLVIFDPSTIIPGPGTANQIRVSCSVTGVGSPSFFILLAAFLPPVVMDVTVNEGDDLLLVCNDNNVGGFTSAHWENSDGELLVQNQRFQMRNVLRNYSGVYTCVLIRNDNNDTLSANSTVTVQYISEITSDERRAQLVPLGDDLSLSCDFDGVPTPIIHWLHNGSLLNDSDPDISITTYAQSSQLRRTNLQRVSGGQYSCHGTNVVGISSIVIKITMIAPPAPVSNLRIISVDDFEVFLEWNNEFDGFSLITGVQIEVFNGNQPVNTFHYLAANNSLAETAVIRSLTPSTEYTFVIRTRNAVGLSDPVSVTGSTQSLASSQQVPYTQAKSNDANRDKPNNALAISFGAAASLMFLVILVQMAMIILLLVCFFRREGKRNKLKESQFNLNENRAYGPVTMKQQASPKETEYECVTTENDVRLYDVITDIPPAGTEKPKLAYRD